MAQANARTDDLMAIAKLVRDGHARTRNEIGDRLALRSTTVSDLVGQLIATDLLRESLSRPRGRGRPAAALNFNHQRLGAVFVTVLGRDIIAHNVDLGRRTLSQARISPPQNTGTDEMAGYLRSLVADALTRFPAGVDPGAIVVSLSGLLDVPNGLWAVSSRWPRLHNLEIREALRDVSVPVHIVRNLDAELGGILMRLPPSDRSSTLVLHWGEGIGAAYYDGSKVVNRDLGRFCEIGHWRLGDAKGRPCTCGSTDCLETMAAMWALAPHLKRCFPGIPDDENALSHMFWRLSLDDCPEMLKALQEVLRVTTNLCRLLFPERVVLTGPFVQNAAVLSGFTDTLREAPLLKSMDQIKVSVSEIGLENEMTGALSDPLNAAMRALLSKETQEASPRPARAPAP